MSEVQECDVLCVGSGAAGLSAALAAGRAGADVVVAEAAERLGGAAAYSGGQLWVGLTDAAIAAGIDDSATDVTRYLDWLSEGRADPALRDVYVSRGPEAVRFLCERGVPLTVVRGMPDYYYPAAPGSKSEGRIHEVEPWDERQLGDLIHLVAKSPYGGGVLSTQDRVDCGGQAPTIELGDRQRRHTEQGERCGGAGLAAALAKAASDHGARFYPSTRATRLLLDGDRVVGAVVRSPRAERTILVRSGVILATGGYDWNAEKLESLDGLRDVRSMAPETTRGDHFTLVADSGAAVAVARMPHTSGTAFGTHTPGEYHSGEPVFRYFTPGLPHSIIVNSSGRRFSDDAFHMAVVKGISGGHDGRADNWPAWVVVDQSFLNKYPMGAVPAGAPVPAGMAASASTLEELGDAAGIDPDGLAGEVLRWNEFSATGRDLDFGRGSLPYTLALHGDARMPNRNLGPIAEPPFYAFPLTRVGVNCPAGGLVIGSDGDVRTDAGDSISGLYAAGNCTAQLDIGAGYNSGMGNQRGLLYGYLAARALTEAAELAL